MKFDLFHVGPKVQDRLSRSFFIKSYISCNFRRLRPSFSERAQNSAPDTLNERSVRWNLTCFVSGQRYRVATSSSSSSSSSGSRGTPRNFSLLFAVLLESSCNRRAAASEGAGGTPAPRLRSDRRRIPTNLLPSTVASESVDAQPLVGARCEVALIESIESTAQAEDVTHAWLRALSRWS